MRNTAEGERKKNLLLFCSFHFQSRSRDAEHRGDPIAAHSLIIVYIFHSPAPRIAQTARVKRALVWSNRARLQHKKRNQPNNEVDNTKINSASKDQARSAQSLSVLSVCNMLCTNEISYHVLFLTKGGIHFG
jgi:hypothetical protein